MSSGCELHRLHAPGNLSVEVHHIIPVAWQLFWQPSTAPFPGRDPNGRGLLWDSRTVTCCPTGHRNVHVWITRMMHAALSNDPLLAMQMVKPKGVQGQWAYTALTRFTEVGGKLLDLVGAHEWGQSLPPPPRVVGASTL